MQPNQHLYLTGYRGTGKTSVGAIVSQRLGREMIDLDRIVEQNTGRLIREIFESGGESAFRDEESKALAEVADGPAAVVSLGGGAILRPSNRTRISATGVCCWLDADPETIAERLENDVATGDQRPSLTSLDFRAEIRQLMDQRRELYAEVADYRIDTTQKSIPDVGAAILSWVEEASGG